MIPNHVIQKLKMTHELYYPKVFTNYIIQNIFIWETF